MERKNTTLHCGEILQDARGIKWNIRALVHQDGCQQAVAIGEDTSKKQKVLVFSPQELAIYGMQLLATA